MPDLYVTPKGTWTGSRTEAAKATRREGSKPGSWKAVSVPTKKAALIDFLNHGWKAPEPEPSPSSKVKPSSVKPKPGARWRVWGGRYPLFIMSTRADNAAQAIAEAASTLIAKPDPTT